MNEMTYKPKCMTRWERAPNYAGEDLSDYYVVISKHRDSNLLEQSNYDGMKEDFLDRDGVEEAHFGHWGVGWIESMIVRKDAPDEVLMELDDVVCSLTEHYPVYDEEDFSRREYEETIDNIMSEGSIDEDTAKEVFSWLWGNDQQQLYAYDGFGGYPTEESIIRALKSIGKYEDEETDES